MNEHAGSPFPPPPAFTPPPASAPSERQSGFVALCSSLERLGETASTLEAHLSPVLRPPSPIAAAADPAESALREQIAHAEGINAQLRALLDRLDL